MPSNPIADVLKDLTKKLGRKIGSLSDVVAPTEALTTANLTVDHLTGVGGLPLGRIIELYGNPSAGKTTTALQAAAQLQQRIIAEGRDEAILYLDFEKGLDPAYCQALGLDIDHPSVIVDQPTWLEDGVMIADRLVQTGKVRLAIYDSVDAMVPREVDPGSRTVAMERARLLKSHLQRCNAFMHEHHGCAVFLNHLTEAINTGPSRPGLPPQETSPGGKALKFYSSLRISYKIVKQIKGKAPDGLTGELAEQVIATIVRCKVTKNKVGVPLREAELRVRLGAGFDNTWSALQVLQAHGAVKRDGAWYRFSDQLLHPAMGLSLKGGRPSIQGEAAVLGFADDHPDWQATLITTAQEAIDHYGAGPQLILSEESLGHEDELFATLETEPDAR